MEAAMGTVNMAAILGLSVEDRITLAERIWDSIAADATTLPLTEEQREELERRLDDHRPTPHEVIGWEEARARTRAKLSK
jgi:putative addiction module component (TIGR02574 family)